MIATFTVDAYASEVFRGAVRQIRNAPQTVQNVVTYDAVIDVANPELKLRPGMTANVSFVYAEKEDVLRAPNAALRFRPPPGFAGAREASGPVAPKGGAEGGDRRTVWALRAGSPVPVRIRTGISDGSLTEVVEGDLRTGDRLVTDAPAPPSGMATGLRRGL